MSKNRGFTLIELMIVVVIIAILAAIAIPSYLKQTRKARRSEVESSIQQVAMAQERFRADCSAYASDFNTACAGAAAIKMPTKTSFYSNSYYTLKISNDSTTTYEVTATAASTGGQTKDSANGVLCKTLTYDFGVTTAGQITKAPADCWSK